VVAVVQEQALLVVHPYMAQVVGELGTALDVMLSLAVHGVHMR